MFFKVIACEIAFRELCHLAAEAPHLIDFEFLTQGHHDRPAAGHQAIQERIDAVPAGKYDAVLLGYGLCSNLLAELRAPHTPLVIPRAHDCLTFFLGSKERYQERFHARPGTYYFTSGWLECRARREGKLSPGHGVFLPSQSGAGWQQTHADWVARYGREKADYLAEVMGDWHAHYTHGTLIDFEFVRSLRLEEQVAAICRHEGWTFERVAGDLGLLRRWLHGEWAEEEFLRVEPGQRVVATFDQRIIGVAPAEASPETS
jgi:hypothetical protein